MFSVVNVREGIAADDYKDPGPYENPAGTVAYEFTGDVGPSPRAAPQQSSGPLNAEFDVVKPGSRPSAMKPMNHH
jgi:hypothetical protein